MARSKIPVVDNSLTPDEQEFIAGGASDNKASNGAPEKQEKTIALNMEVPVRLKNEMKAYKEYGGFKRIGDLQEAVWEFYKEHHQSKFQEIQHSWNIETKD